MNAGAIVVLLAFGGEVIDAGLGMMYGTLLSPILVLMGYSPQLVVPSILISQAAGGLVGTIRHNSLGNSDFNGMTRDTKIALSILVPGIAATILGAYVASSVSSSVMNLYIGSLVVVAGGLCFVPHRFNFSFRKMWVVGALAGFNKAMSGGGFGPVTTTGKVLGGIDAKVSIATTTYAEVPICLLGFGLWIAFNGWLTWQFPVLLCVGAMTGGMIGPYITQKANANKLRIAVAILAVGCGIVLLHKVLG